MTASHTNTVFLLVSNFCWLAGCHWLKFIVFQLQVCQIIIINCFSSKFLPLTTVRFGHNFTKVNIKLSTNQTEIQFSIRVSFCCFNSHPKISLVSWADSMRWFAIFPCLEQHYITSDISSGPSHWWEHYLLFTSNRLELFTSPQIFKSYKSQIIRNAKISNRTDWNTE